MKNCTFWTVEKANVWTCDGDPAHFSPAAAQSGDSGGVDWLRDAGSSVRHGETLQTCPHELGRTLGDGFQNKSHSSIYSIYLSTILFDLKWRTDLIQNIDRRVTLLKITDVDQSAEQVLRIEILFSLDMHRK